MTEPLRIVPGSRVLLHIAISLNDGTEALSTFKENPLDVVVGDGTLDPGIELALYGMCAGKKDSITLLPGQAFGDSDPERVEEMPLSDFSADAPPIEGQIIAFSTPSGEEIAGTVIQIAEHIAMIDFNHPLAGRELLLRLEILGVTAPTEPS